MCRAYGTPIVTIPFIGGLKSAATKWSRAYGSLSYYRWIEIHRFKMRRGDGTIFLLVYLKRTD
jgi:hypothetical protein